MFDQGAQALPGSAPTIVIVSSVHDYRMVRRGSIQAVADAFYRAGFRTVFLSLRFSLLSLLKNDPRAGLAGKANAALRQREISRRADHAARGERLDRAHRRGNAIGAAACAKQA